MRFTSIPLEDDSTDRMHHYLTSIILFISLLISSKRQYIGSPISCWCPKSFTRAHVEYAENFCWTSNTYHVPPQISVPTSIQERKAAQLVYYQWVPCLLLVQIIFFQIPNCFWIAWYPTTGIQVRAIIETASKAARVDPSIRHKIIRQIARHLLECLSIRKRLYGSSLCIMYFFTKALYLSNVLLQFAVLLSFLGGGISKRSIFPDFTVDYGNQTRVLFPRATLCDLTIRQMGENLHRYTIQCVLPINRVNEKIYLAIRLWFVVLAVLTLVSIVRWSVRLLFHSARVDHVCKLLEREEYSPSPESYSHVIQFTNEILHHDGVLLLFLLGHNAGNLVASEIATWLWVNYRGRKLEKGRVMPSAPPAKEQAFLGVEMRSLASPCPSGSVRTSQIITISENEKDVVVPCQFLFNSY